MRVLGSVIVPDQAATATAPARITPLSTMRTEINFMSGGTVRSFGEALQQLDPVVQQFG
jgi:hypothetical protein